MKWIREQLKSAVGTPRKFIITNHIYPGAKFVVKSKDLLMENYTKEIFEMLYEYRG